jgi:hypothetical protein
MVIFLTLSLTPDPSPVERGAELNSPAVRWRGEHSFTVFSGDVLRFEILGLLSQNK